MVNLPRNRRVSRAHPDQRSKEYLENRPIKGRKWHLAISHLQSSALNELEKERGVRIKFRQTIQRIAKSEPTIPKLPGDLFLLSKGLAACREWIKEPKRRGLNRGAASFVDLHRSRQGLNAVATSTQQNMRRRDSAAMQSTQQIVTLLLLAFATKTKKPALEFATWHPYTVLLRHVLGVGLNSDDPKMYQNDIARAVYAKLYRMKKGHRGVFPISEAMNCWSQVAQKMRQTKTVTNGP